MDCVRKFRINNAPTISIYGTLVFLVAFYLYILGGMITTVSFPGTKAALPFSLFSSTDAQYTLWLAQERSGELPRWWMAAVLNLHGKNAYVLNELAMYEMAKNHTTQAQATMEATLLLDPKQLDYYKIYAGIRDQQGKSLHLLDETKLLSRGYLSSTENQKIQDGIRLYGTRLLPKLASSRLDYSRISNMTIPETLAKLCYLYGLNMLHSFPEGVPYWWGLAAELDPGTSYYVVEWADYYAEQLHDVTQAKKILTNCQTNSFAKKHCAEALIEMQKGIVADAGFYRVIILSNLFLKEQHE